MMRFPTAMWTACWLLCGVVFTARAADNWPRFRGPDATGVAADDPRLPTTWSVDENVAWVSDIPGWGWSNPIVWEDRVFLTTVVTDAPGEEPQKGLYLGEGRDTPPAGLHHWLVYCLRLEDGAVAWTHEAHVGYPQVPRHPKSTYASETPTTDGERLYALFGDLGLYCFSMDGEVLWSHEIEPKKTRADYGAAASPVLAGDQIIMIYDNEEESYITALDGRTGEQRWRTPRDEPSTWSTPFVWETPERTEIVTLGFKKTRGYDLAGNVLWSLKGPMSHLVIPSPFASRGLVYITTGHFRDKHRPVYAVRAGARGEIVVQNDAPDSEHLAWYLPLAGPYNPSPIVYGDYYYTLFDHGFLTCHQAATGEQVYGKKSLRRGSSFTSSPWAYNGKLFFLSEDGDTYVVRPGEDFELLATNSLGELCMASPAISQGRLLVRTASKLYCLTETNQ